MNYLPFKIYYFILHFFLSVLLRHKIFSYLFLSHSALHLSFSVFLSLSLFFSLSVSILSSSVNLTLFHPVPFFISSFSLFYSLYPFICLVSFFLIEPFILSFPVCVSIRLSSNLFSLLAF